MGVYVGVNVVLCSVELDAVMRRVSDHPTYVRRARPGPALPCPVVFCRHRGMVPRALGSDAAMGPGSTSRRAVGFHASVKGHILRFTRCQAGVP